MEIVCAQHPPRTQRGKAPQSYPCTYHGGATIPGIEKVNSESEKKKKGGQVLGDFE
jgi:hypothetical protein